MPPFSLDLRDAITVITGIVTIAGVIFSLRGATAQLKVGQDEMLRQIVALHKRMDGYAEKIEESRIKHAVLAERVDNIRNTQRIRAARVEAASVGQPPMFEGED